MQHTAAASEELSSTAEEMSAQAIGLQEAMTFFKLTSDGYSGGQHQTSSASPRRQEPKLSVAKAAPKASHKKVSHGDDIDKNFVSFK
jgi:methyl-accepting chemotaxis protein